jgi:hypothetical protein
MRHSMAKKMSLRGVEAVLDPHGKLTQNMLYVLLLVLEDAGGGPGKDTEGTYGMYGRASTFFFFVQAAG